MPTKLTKPTYQQTVETFAAMFGPFTRNWKDYRSFRFFDKDILEVHWPGMNSKLPPLIDFDEKPRCACCGSARPMSLYILTGRSGTTHMVGQECLLALQRLRQVTHLDDTPDPHPDQLPPPKTSFRRCRDCVHWQWTTQWQGRCPLFPTSKDRWSETAQPFANCDQYTEKGGG